MSYPRVKGQQFPTMPLELSEFARAAQTWGNILLTRITVYRHFPGSSVVKNLPAMQKPQEMQLRSLDLEDPLEKGLATHSGILAWRTPWTEEWQATVHGVTRSQT